eukprot:TRINITY_DN14168_c0_g1_i1.p1 TRINITY_DN14168_c0_g1~~TRINITY_DN14168_c0_g1_i1.p1  ORF type:complete len:125 (+),score=8.99 TRINITY_DN14168_c0_g1_i1:2-376(+)
MKLLFLSLSLFFFVLAVASQTCDSTFDSFYNEHIELDSHQTTFWTQTNLTQISYCVSSGSTWKYLLQNTDTNCTSTEVQNSNNGYECYQLGCVCNSNYFSLGCENTVEHCDFYNICLGDQELCS